MQRADMSKRKVKNIITAYTFLLPNFVGFLLFTLIPIVCSMGLSFMEWDSANPMKFVGLANFAKLLEDETFSISLKNNRKSRYVGAFQAVGGTQLILICIAHWSI